jgi:PhnB protein
MATFSGHICWTLGWRGENTPERAKMRCPPGGRHVSTYQAEGLHAVRPYLVVGDADAAIKFYATVFDAVEIERHTTPNGGVGHAKFRIGESIIEIGETPAAAGRDAPQLPSVGLRLYVPDVDEAFARATAAGATGDAPSDRPDQGTRAASVYDPFGLTWWLATPLNQASR